MMTFNRFCILAYGLGVLTAIVLLTWFALPIMSVGVAFWWGATCATTVLIVGAILTMEWLEELPTILSPETQLDCWGNILPNPSPRPSCTLGKKMTEEEYW